MSASKISTSDSADQTALVINMKNKERKRENSSQKRKQLSVTGNEPVSILDSNLQS